MSEALAVGVILIVIGYFLPKLLSKLEEVIKRWWRNDG